MPWQLLQYNGAWDALMTECDSEMRDALTARVAQLALKGNQVTYPVTEALGDGLFEVRARANRVRIRALFGFAPGRRVVIVWGGTKDQRRLRPATIKLARRLLSEALANLEALHVANLH
jgi:hypothetical protein